MALTTPDGLPYPTDYADPADTPAALEDLAIASQTALSSLRSDTTTLRNDTTAGLAQKLNLSGGEMTGQLRNETDFGIVSRHVCVFQESSGSYIDAGGTLSAIYANERMGIWVGLDTSVAGGQRADIYVHRLFTYAGYAAPLPASVQSEDGSTDVGALLALLVTAVQNLDGGPEALAAAALTIEGN